jgi:hypothetical protein
MTSINTVDPKAAIAKAQREIAEEQMSKAVTALKVKYRELAAAETVVENVKREIANLELKIEQGNL